MVHCVERDFKFAEIDWDLHYSVNKRYSSQPNSVYGSTVFHTA